MKTKLSQYGYVNKAEKIKPILDKLVDMYWNEYFTFDEIAEQIGERWWTVKELFKKYNVPRMSLAERAKMRRQRDYELVCKLFCEQHLSINQIYKTYNLSPPYVRRILRENNIAMY